MRSATPAEAGMAQRGLGFERPVQEGGYRWWYVDGFSDCGQFGITIIAFIGSVFSPYYYRARHRGVAQASNHVSLNVILYGPSKSRWCMTERGVDALRQSPHELDIGPSGLRTSSSGLEIDILERATPLGQRVAGSVSLSFDRATDQCFELGGVGEHWWWPIAPIARIDVAMERPGLRWSGAAYVDSNCGSDRSKRASPPGTGVEGMAQKATARFITTRSSVVAVRNGCRSRLIDRVRWRACHHQIFSSSLADRCGGWRALPEYRVKRGP